MVDIFREINLNRLLMNRGLIEPFYALPTSAMAAIITSS